LHSHAALPGLEFLDSLRGEVLAFLRTDGCAPALGGQKEVVDAAADVLAERDRLGYGFQVRLIGNLVTAVGGAPGADEGVAAAQVESEPGCGQAGAHGVQP